MNKGFSQPFIDGARPMFTLRLRLLSHMETGSVQIRNACVTGVTDALG